MTHELFTSFLHAHADAIAAIGASACALHANVNQTYDETLPYGHHLTMVANTVQDFGGEIVACEADVVPVVFAAYYHDSIEDARQTYNDVMRTARQWMTDEQALMATEIVYALTNDKGRTRAERAGEKYYAGIRCTPYAPLLKLCDRYANMSYSLHGTDASNIHMRSVYRNEWPHFLEAITSHDADPRLALPQALISEITKLIDNVEQQNS